MALWSFGVSFLLAAVPTTVAPAQIPTEEYEKFGKPDVVSAASLSLELYNEQIYEMYQYNFIEVVGAEVQQVEDGVLYSLDVEASLDFSQQQHAPYQQDFGVPHLCHFELLMGKLQSVLRKTSCTAPSLYLHDYSLASSIAQYAVDQYNICPSNLFLYSVYWIISSREQQHVKNGCIYSILFYMMKCKKDLCNKQMVQKLKSLTVKEMNKLMNSSNSSHQLVRNPDPNQFLEQEPTVIFPEAKPDHTQLKPWCYCHIFLCSFTVWLKSDRVVVLRDICLPNPYPNRNCCKM